MSDYFLNKIYDSLLSKKPVPKKPIVEKKEVKKFESLSNVYYRVLVEQEEGEFKVTGEPIDEPSKKETIGVVSQNQYDQIKNRVRGIAVKPDIEEILNLSGGWSEITDYQATVVERFASNFMQNQIPATVLDSLKKNKPELNKFENAVKSSHHISNLVDLIVDDVYTHTNQQDQTSDLKQKLKSVVNDTFLITGKINMVGVGEGEIALTFFTNAKKGTKGDVQLSNNQLVEVKGKGGRLGKAPYSATNTASALANFLEKQQIKPNVSKIVFAIKPQIQAARDKIKGLEGIAPEYLQIINSFLVNLNTPEELNKVYQSSNFNTLRPQEAAQQYIQTADPQILNRFKDQHTLIRTKVNSVLQSFTTQADNILDPEELKRSSFTMAVQRFFLNNIGLTPEQAAEAFLETRSFNNVNLEQYKNEIIDYFKTNYSKMIDGNVGALKAGIFAMQALCYHLEDRVDYLLVTNIASNTKSSAVISFNASNLFTSLINQYFLLQSKGLDLSFKADERGGSGISFNG
jgi:hypothetical protein